MDSVVTKMVQEKRRHGRHVHVEIKKHMSSVMKRSLLLFHIFVAFHASCYLLPPFLRLTLIGGK